MITRFEASFVLVQEAFASLKTGYLFYFDLADFKRRNHHMTHTVGDLDIALFEQLLKSVFLDPAQVLRTGGDNWIAVASEIPETLLSTLVGEYVREDVIVFGWVCEATLENETRTHTEKVAMTVGRAFRAFYTPFSQNEPFDLCYQILESTPKYLCPVNQLCAVPLVSDEPLQDMWRSAIDTTLPSFCPYCRSQKFCWEDGASDGGSGNCLSCGAMCDFQNYRFE